jgi:hypothetical protein
MLPSVLEAIAPNTRRGFDGDLQGIEADPHALPHNFIGGDLGTMGGVFSSFDPLFWLHHCNVDKWFALYQNYAGHDKIKSVDARANVHGPKQLNRPLLYSGDNIPPEVSHFFYAPGTNNFPTSQKVLLNDNLVKVTYAGDTLAKHLKGLLMMINKATTISNQTPTGSLCLLPTFLPMEMRIYLG